MPRGALFCATCGASIAGAGGSSLELVLRDGTRVSLADAVSLGREPDNAVRFDDRSVSRHHARVVPDGGGVFLEDAGSSHGTFINGTRLEGRVRLEDGMKIQLGEVELEVERRRGESEAGKTIVVRPGASLLLPAVGRSKLEAGATSFGGLRPRVRSGWALKRLDAEEGRQRYILKDMRKGDFVRMGSDEAELFELLDGRYTLPELITESEKRFGLVGAGRLARLLADLGERGLLEGVQGREEPVAPVTGRARLFRPRDHVWTRAGEVIDRIYARGGWLLFTQAALALLALVSLAGLAAFAYLVVGRYGTPFVVAQKIGIGGAVFLLGRFVVVAFHELAHGLTAASFGRRVSRAGVKLVFVFPFAFVDVSDSWFEPRRRRMAITIAGPASDFVVGAAFGIISAALDAGTVRDVFFQLALAAYVGAFFNLNPFLDRDGYQILVDKLGEPGLRRRARERLALALAGKPTGPDEPRIIRLYGIAVLIWSLVAVGFVILMTSRYYDQLVALAPREVVWGVLGAFYLLMFVPVVLVVGKPLAERWRPRAAVDADVGL